MKNIVIVGASSGIGLKVAEAFASRGLRVGLAARRTAVLEELKAKYPDMVEYEAIDINRDDAPERLNALIDKLGGMDLYFHVSGIGFVNNDLDPTQEAQVIQTNLGGFARMLSAAYGYFKATGRKGRIAAVTSVAGTKGIGSMAAYSASKRGASAYMVALEQRAYNEDLDIRFTDIRPGWIETPLIDPDRPYPMLMTLDYAVPLIIKAIVKAPRVAYVDWRYGLLVAGWKRIPTWLWIHMDVSRM